MKDIRAIFEGEGGEACKAITTCTLIGKLCELEEAPWATFFRGQRINPRGLARMLRPFGIVSANLKLGRGPGHREGCGCEGLQAGIIRRCLGEIFAATRYLARKGAENPGNQGKTGVARQVAVAMENPLPDRNKGGVADNCRYRYPTATEGEAKKGPFSKEIQGDGAGGSGVAEKKEARESKASSRRARSFGFLKTSRKDRREGSATKWN